MGMLDSLKKATGLGLSHSEHFDRAYEKAVLLGEAHYAKAVELFENAAKKAAEAGDRTLEVRSRANASLYGFITTGNEQHLTSLTSSLQELPDIEKIGSKSETMPTAPLLGEVHGRMAEFALARVAESDYVARARAHAACAEAFKRIFNENLVTYRFRAEDGHRETAQARFFFHQGRSFWSQALADVASSPETAAENMSRALSAFRQCGDADWASRAESWRESCRLKRTCWMCQREFQGSGIHFRSFPASVTPYATTVVQTLGQDTSTLDVASSSLVLCNPCGSTIELLADRYATMRTQELRQEVQQALRHHEEAIVALVRRVDALEKVAHRH